MIREVNIFSTQYSLLIPVGFLKESLTSTEDSLQTHVRKSEKKAKTFVLQKAKSTNLFVCCENYRAP